MERAAQPSVVAGVADPRSDSPFASSSKRKGGPLFVIAYNDHEWLIERHGHQTPAAVRAAFAAVVAA